MLCDNESGQCLIPSAAEMISPARREQDNGSTAIHYIGDPMCSWCWGLSNSVIALEAFAKENGYRFVLTNGGLRAGGGDPWTPAFKQFLRQEWEHISNVTGQYISCSLLESEYFNYDTEPACRAVVSAAMINPDVKLTFFRAVQKKFYTESADPKEISFYENICAQTGINFAEFADVFNSHLSLLETLAEFRMTRQFGVSSFPSILVEQAGVLHRAVSGYVNEKDIITRVIEAQKRLI